MPEGMRFFLSLPPSREQADLCYTLYTICDHQSSSKKSRGYQALRRCLNSNKLTTSDTAANNASKHGKPQTSKNVSLNTYEGFSGS